MGKQSLPTLRQGKRHLLRQSPTPQDGPALRSSRLGVVSGALGQASGGCLAGDWPKTPTPTLKKCGTLAAALGNHNINVATHVPDKFAIDICNVSSEPCGDVAKLTPCETAGNEMHGSLKEAW